MEKFGMSFGGGGPSRKELLDVVETQKKQLAQYQTRLKDVVRAYKSLLKEKEALEASLKVLSTSQDVVAARPGEDAEDVCSLYSEDSADTAASADARPDHNPEEPGDPGGPSGSDAGGSETDGAEPQAAAPPGSEADRGVGRLKSQLSTLTGALATVTQEKSRMEAHFQADKRQLKQELEELQGRLAAATALQEAELQGLQQQLAESRARIITQQHEREQEQGDQLQQLRELQRLLQQERDLRQDAELRLQEADATALLGSRALDAESEARLARLAEERDELRRRLRAAEEEQRKPDPRVERLQEELGLLKNHLQEQVHSQTRKVCQAEEVARERAQAAEGRVAVLEQRLSELSDLLGSSEKSRQKEQQAAQRLRERVLQLDLENKTLALAASGRPPFDLGADESPLDVAALKEKLQKVKKLLLAAQSDPRANGQGPEEEGGDDGEEEAEEAGDPAACRRALRQLRDEFERYKLRAQVVLKNKNAKDGCQAKELADARDQLTELKDKYITLRIQGDQAEQRHRRQQEERQQQAAALQLAHRQEAERAAAQHRDELLRLEAELHKQRERSLALLDEKDRDLERLRASACASASACAPGADRGGEEEESEGDAISQALQQATPTEPTLLLYAEQLARKEVEAAALRRHKHQLEDDLHRLQAKVIANAERHDEETALLREQLDKLSRDQRREGANMEYLKNVIYKFLTLQDASGRQQTLTAILAILHFSPQEKHAIHRLQALPWWTSKR